MKCRSKPMNVTDVENLLHKYDSCLDSIGNISVEKESVIPLCNLSDVTYSYDKIIATIFAKEEERPRSVDAISIKDGFVNFIEFKDARMHNTKTKQEIRMKISESLHSFERILLGNNFMATHGINSRFILVYSKQKNEDYLRKQREKEPRVLNNAVLSFSTLSTQKEFVHDKYDKLWRYVDEAISMNEEEFTQNKSLYL